MLCETPSSTPPPQHCCWRCRKWHVGGGGGRCRQRQQKAAGPSLLQVALDTAAEARLARETTACVRQYTLPDGRVISVGGADRSSRRRGSSCLRSPSLAVTPSLAKTA